MIEQKSIDEVIEKADIVEIISEFIDIKKQGANYIGLSPFTNEKTPSFVISPSKQIFKDFSSGKGGDVITFLIEHEKITFVEAINWLAKYYNISLKTTSEPVNNENLKNELLQLNTYAKDFFKQNLLNSASGHKALDYFKSRNIAIETINSFELGFALNSFDALTKSAISQGFDIKNLHLLGLSSNKEEGKYYDKFRDRIIFPIFSLSNQIIGFGGRISNNETNLAKYINSNESIIYSKRNTLYGLNIAKQHIIKNDSCYLVEGYLDVLSMHQAGITNTVASSGTALTQEQVKLISRFTKNINILYDGDPAGINASLKAVEIILHQDQNPNIIKLPDNHDPNSYIHKYGENKFNEYIISNTKDFIEYFVQNIYANTSDIGYKTESIISILKIISCIPNNIKQNLFVEKLSKLTQLDYNTLKIELEKIFKENNKKFNNEPIQTNEIPSYQHQGLINNENTQEYEIIRIILTYGNEKILIEDKSVLTINVILESLVDIKFKNPIYQQIINIIRENVTTNGFDTKLLIHNINDQLKTVVADTLTEKYKPSPRYIKKYQVTEEKNILLKLIENTINQLKFNRINEHLNEIENQMVTAKTETELINMQERYNTLIEEKCQIGKKMLRVF